MIENEECSLCDLATTCSPKSICLKGGGSRDAALMVYLDAPTIVEDRRGRGLVSDAAEFLKWLLRRMSVTTDQVYVDYVLKCFPKPNKNFGKKAFRQQYIEACSYYRVATLQQIKPKAVIAMGATACEAFVGSEKVANYEGTSWTPIEPRVREIVDQVWVTFSPAYALQDPAESVPIYRTLFAAAEQAGLKPKLNRNITLYDYGF